MHKQSKILISNM